jgi:broad specificity phosphatase PhoE
VTEATAESALVEMLLTLELTEELMEAALELWEARTEETLLEAEARAEEADWPREVWARATGAKTATTAENFILMVGWFCW